MGKDLGRAIITMKAKDQRGTSPHSRGRPWRRKHNGENLSSSLSGAPECHREGIIAAVIVFINITIFITILIPFTRSTLPHPAVIPYLKMVLYDTYYDPMMCCHPMMF